MRSRWLVSLAVVAVLTGAVAGCGPRTWVDPGVAPGESREQLQRQANDALARWAAVVDAAGGPYFYLALGDQTGQTGSWEPGVGDNNKGALGAGMLVAVTALTEPAPPTGTVRWADGTVRTLPSITAAAALERLVAAGGKDCPTCVPLRVTGARLSTAQLQTGHGEATLPVWEYSLAGTAVRVVRPAVDTASGVSYTPPPWDSAHPPAGLSVDKVTVNGLDLTATFVGAPGPAEKFCGVDYTAEAMESATAVVVIVFEHPYQGSPPDGNSACVMMGALRAATARLAQPLADRAVLEVRQGLPVPVTVIRR